MIFGGLAVGTLFIIILGLVLAAWLLNFAGVDPSWLEALERFVRGVFNLNGGR